MSAESKLSIVIPVHNNEATLDVCLSSIYASKGVDGRFEVVVVDDGSTDGSVEVAGRFPCRVVSLPQNMGVSAARNAGAREASHEIIYFVDGDIVQKPETIRQLLDAFDEDPDLAVAQAVWAKEALNSSFGGDFWARKTYFLIKISQLGDVEVRKDAKSFNSGCMALKRDVFWEFGGFDERYRRPGGEEHLLAFNMAQKYRLYQYKGIEVYHHFARTLPKIRIQFNRAIRLGGIFGSRRKFGSVGSTTKGEAARCGLATVTIPLFLLAFLSGWLVHVPLAIFLLFVASGFGFYRFLARERGLGFALAGVLLDFLLYFVTGIGLGCGIAGMVLKKLTGKGEAAADE